MKTVVHLTSAHPRDDIRIFRKMCLSLTKLYNVSLVVADGLGDSLVNGVSIFDVGILTGRFARMTKSTEAVYLKALELDADLYHLHDPELMPIALKLKRKGYKVVFDCHEDLPKQLKSKPYLNAVAKVMLPSIFERYESYTFRRLDAVVGATPVITSKLKKLNRFAVNINNYPILGELSFDTNWEFKCDEVCYLGGIAEIRGIRQVISALALTSNISLNLAGKFSEPSLEKEMKTLPQWKKVNELGFIGREEAAEVLARSKVGIVTFLPYPNHIDAQPNKMFEYMSAGLPIVTSNFPMWREIVEGNNCGICVDPLDSKAIAKAVEYIISHPSDAAIMAENGLLAVKNKYNWMAEEKCLFDMYRNLLG